MLRAGGALGRPSRGGALIAGLVASIAATAGGCTHVMYDGPRRAASEVARLSTWKIEVTGVDGREKSGSEFELLPGNHTIQYHLNAHEFRVLYTEHFSSGTVSSCVKLKAGHQYTLYAVVNGNRWDPILLDQTMNRSVFATCGPDEDDD